MNNNRFLKRMLYAAALFLAAVLAVSCSPAGDPFGTSAVSEDSTRVPGDETDNNPHVCEWGEWEISVQPGCAEDGKETRSCVCGRTEERVIPASHVYYGCVRMPDVLSGGYTRHICARCGNSYDDSRTDRLSPTPGLEFMDAPDGDGLVLRGRGSFSGAEIAVPSEVDGKPVTGVWTQAFNGDRELKAVYLPEGVKFIGPMAFGECSSLEKVGIPSSVVTVSEYAFYGCSALTEVTAEGVRNIGEAAFALCGSLVCAELGSGLETLGPECFSCCTSMEIMFYGGTAGGFESVKKADGWNRLDEKMEAVFLG